MRYFLIIAGAFVLGGYSVLGLHHYSLLQSRTKSIWIRLVFFIVVIALFIFLPMIGVLFLLEIYSVRYEAVNAMLLNEFLKRTPQSRATGEAN